jgi:hypothetical protein
MFGGKVSTDVREIRLLDSQDIDYNVRLQKYKQDCDSLVEKGPLAWTL